MVWISAGTRARAASSSARTKDCSRFGMRSSQDKPGKSAQVEAT